jgi:hypothetical protein
MGSMQMSKIQVDKTKTFGTSSDKRKTGTEKNQKKGGVKAKSSK